MDIDPHRAIKTAILLEGQVDIWAKHLKTFGHAHWHIIEFIRRFGIDGVPLRRIFAHVSGIFGMDISTCTKRLRELLDHGLLHGDSDKMTRSTLIGATPLLRDQYNSYGVELANLMISLSFADASKPIVNGPGGDPVNDVLAGFFDGLASHFQPRLDGFIRDNVASPAKRERVRHCMSAFGYWRAVSICWRVRCEETPFIYVDELHVALYPITKKSPESTKQIVFDLLQWNFLCRLGKAEGVPNNRFAVAISDPAFALLSEGFERGAELMIDTSQILLKATDTVGPENSRVVPIKRPIPQTVVDGPAAGSAAGSA